MPPNRKAHFEITRNLASLKIAHPSAALKAPEVAPQPIDSASYWEWPADTAEVQKKHPAQTNDSSNKVVDDLDDLFSANHIVANLVQAAAEQLSENKQLKQAAGTTQESSEDYWFQPFKHHAVLADVVDNRFTSAHHVEAHLIEAAEGAAVRRHNDRADDQGNDDYRDSTTNPEESVAYWNWPAWKEKDSEALFSADRVEACLVMQAAAKQLLEPTTTIPASSASAPSSFDYWAF